MGSLRSSEAFLARQGISQVVEEAVCELALCQPPAAARAGDEYAGAQEEGSRDAAAAGFLADVLAEKLDERAGLKHAERLVTQCDVRSAVLYDRLGEAFLLLAEDARVEQAQEQEDKSLRVDDKVVSASHKLSQSPGVFSRDVVHLQRKLCKRLPKSACERVLKLARPVSLGYLLSYNDFMCHIGACLAVRELGEALREAFAFSASGNGFGCVSLDAALKILEAVDWDQGLANLKQGDSNEEMRAARRDMARDCLEAAKGRQCRGNDDAGIKVEDFVCVGIEMLLATGEMSQRQEPT